MRHLLICIQLSVLVALTGCSSSSSRNGVDDDLCSVATLVTDSWPGAAGGDPESITAVSGKLYYQVNDGVHGEELWVYDPAAGPGLLADIVPGSGGGDPDHLVELDGILYFSANDENLGRELWAYHPSGPLGGATLIADINSGSASSGPSDLTVMGGNIYFLAYDAVHGSEPWVYNPASGAIQLADIRPGEDGSFIREFVIFDDRLYFAAHDGDSIGLWVYDPGAAALSSIEVGTVPMSFGSGPSQLTILDEKLYFTANDGVSGNELWVFDSASGASLAADINSGGGSSNPFGLTPHNGKLYMGANDGLTGDELWVFDPSAGATKAADIFPGDQSGLCSSTIVAMLDRLYFVARDNVNGPELREYNPETGVVRLIADIVPGVGGTGDDDPEPPDNLTVLDNILYFTAHDGGTWRYKTLWSYTPDAGPLMIDEAWPDTGISRMPRSTTELDGLLYFNVDDGVHGPELWAYDGACDGVST